MVGESEKAREITFEIDLKGWTESRQPGLKKERIPDIGTIVSQSLEEGKPRLVTVGMRAGGERKLQRTLEPVFKEEDID